MIVDAVPLPHPVRAWFTGAEPDAPPLPVGQPGNLSHRRPHRPVDLAAARGAVGAATGTDPGSWHLMQQVHGAEVAVVDASTPPGAELRAVDAAVTALPDRPLAVLVADCVPVIFACERAVGVAHAGRAGVAAGVVPAAVAALRAGGVEAAELTAVIGPAIGGCCYEVPAQLRDEVEARVPGAAATTTWGTPALDLPAAVEEQLDAAGVRDVRRLAACTRCDPQHRWFSHRRDPAAGRQLGLVVLEEVA